MPEAASFAAIAPVAVAVCWFLALPSNLALYWAARYLSPVTTGMLMMISANDLIALYVGLELQSLSLYVVAAFDRRSARSRRSRCA